MLPELIVVIIVATLNFTKVNDQESYLELFSLFKTVRKNKINSTEKLIAIGGIALGEVKKNMIFSLKLMNY